MASPPVTVVASTSVDGPAGGAFARQWLAQHPAGQAIGNVRPSGQTTADHLSFLQRQGFSMHDARREMRDLLARRREDLERGMSQQAVAEVLQGHIHEQGERRATDGGHGFGLPPASRTISASASPA